MRFSLQILIAVALLVIGLLILIRTAPMGVARWHVDPETAPVPTTPNYHLLRDTGGTVPAFPAPASLAETAAALDRIILARAHTMRLAGSAEAGLVTYVERTPLMRYPDAISVRLTPTGHTTRISILSRSRFGYSDLGANRARVEAILAELTTALTADAP